MICSSCFVESFIYFQRELQSKHILDKQISHGQDQSDTEQQQSEGHASGDHRAVLGPLFLEEGQTMFVVLRSGIFPVNGKIAQLLES